jgi:hypothetical protein
MGLTCTVGGARATFESGFAREVAELLDSAFGGESDWEGISPRQFGELLSTSWAEFRRKAAAELGDYAIPNLLAMSADGRGVYLPANVQAVSLPLPAGGPLRCASLPGLRRELSELAERWELPLDDEGLTDIVRAAAEPDDGPVADAPEVLAFARLALAANEAVRGDCPLWLVGE